MANDLDLLTENIYQKYYIEPVVIYDEDVNKRDIKQAKISVRLDPFISGMGTYEQPEYLSVDGFVFRFCYPFSGDEALFHCRASTMSCSPYPEIEINKGYMIIAIEKKSNDQGLEKDAVLKQAERFKKEILNGIGFANNDVNSFNNTIKDYILKHLVYRRNQVEKYYELSKSFEIKVEATDYSKSIVPVERKIAPIQHKYNSESTYIIKGSTYKDILEVIQNAAATFERTPKTYSKMKEEELRDIILANLNSVFNGAANGEAFRNRGKTDISIEQDNRAAFVAECKIWGGKSLLRKAIDQLDGYLTWRDCKTALIYFSRNKDFISVLATLKEELNIIGCMRSVRTEKPNVFDCTFASNSNPGQLVELCVMVFNISC